MIKAKTERKHLYTPLRYPGGKTSLFRYFASLIEAHGWSDMTYVEPFAGGAGAALSLLFLEKVDAVVINDYDPAIYAFWKSATENTDKFIKLIETTPITVSEWEFQKKIYKCADLSNPLELGFATFFLNRTNRSGILNAGPVGGKQQLSKWKIDARYNKSSMVDKIRLIGLYRKRITVLNQDGNEVIDRYARDKNHFLYIDPPYFVKGADLYLNAFKLADHQNLAATLSKYPNAKWLLSYDNVEEIVDLYTDFNYEVFSLKYSAHHSSKLGSELMVFSNAVDQGILRLLD